MTMEGIAKEGGVAYQTVYAVFGSKLQLGKEVVHAGFHFEGLDELMGRANAPPDPEVGDAAGR